MSLYSKCFRECIIEWMCGKCMCRGLDLGTHGFGSGHQGGR